MAIAQTILTQDLADELVLVDAKPEKLRGEMLDLQHAAAFLPLTKIIADVDHAVGNVEELLLQVGKEASLVTYDGSGDKFYMAMEDKVMVHEAKDARLLELHWMVMLRFLGIGWTFMAWASMAVVERICCRVRMITAPTHDMLSSAHDHSCTAAQAQDMLSSACS